MCAAIDACARGIVRDLKAFAEQAGMLRATHDERTLRCSRQLPSAMPACGSHAPGGVEGVRGAHCRLCSARL